MGTLAATGLGKKTRAQEALRGVSLRGRRAVVTGASSGIGVETARVLALAGADVVMAVRNTAEGERVAAELRSKLPAGSGSLSVHPLDLSDLKKVRASAEALLAKPGAIDLLVNNAGVMAPPLGFTQQGFEQQMGVNHLGHFLFTSLLLPRITQSSGARIVNLSSAAHYRGSGAGVLGTLDTDRRYQTRKYGRWSSYGDSKLANVLFTRGLAKRLPAGALALSLHPGVINTKLGRHLGIGGTIGYFLGKFFMKTVEQGAATTIFAAVAPELAGHSGIFLSDCNERRPHEDALDDALVEKVWALSERLVAENS